MDFEAIEELDNNFVPRKESKMTKSQLDSIKINPDLPSDFAKAMREVLSKYADCFSWDIDEVGNFPHGPPLNIDTGDSPPIYIPPYALGSKEKEFVRTQIEA